MVVLREVKIVFLVSLVVVVEFVSVVIGEVVAVSREVVVVGVIGLSDGEIVGFVEVDIFVVDFVIPVLGAAVIVVELVVVEAVFLVAPVVVVGVVLEVIGKVVVNK